MSDFLLTQIINYGAPFLGVIVFISALGAPFPCTLLVIAAGAFAKQGLLTWYTTGVDRAGICGSWRQPELCNGTLMHANPSCAAFKARRIGLRRNQPSTDWGGMAVVWTRFLITGIAVPVNLIAGTSGFGIRRFFVYDLIGETVWIFGYGGLGYLFGAQWEAVSDVLGNISGLLLGLILLGIGIWLGIRRLKVIEARKAKVPEL